MRLVPAALLAALVLTPPAWAGPIYALVAGNELEQFDSATPGTVTMPLPVTGLVSGEVLVGIDFRPATGQLYALSSQSRMYVINTSTGAATQVGMDGAFTLSGVEFGMDFNPVVDRIRVVSDTKQDLRLNPATGGLTGTDTPLSYSGSAGNPVEVAVAYTNNFSGASSTTLYGIDSAIDSLVTQGSPNGSPFSPNTGLLFTVGALGVDTTATAGLDISAGNVAYALLHVAGGGALGGLYTVNLATGAVTFVGSIGGSLNASDIAVRAVPTAVRMLSLTAARTRAGVALRWRAATSWSALGFNVLREDPGGRVRLNRSLIPSALASSSQTYAFVDRRPPKGHIRYWIESVAPDGSRAAYGPVSAG